MKRKKTIRIVGGALIGVIACIMLTIVVLFDIAVIKKKAQARQMKNM